MALRGKFFCAIASQLLPYQIYWESSWSMCLSVFNLSSVLVGLSVWMIMNLWKIDFHQSIFTTFMNFHEHSWTLPHELWPFFYEVDSTSRLGRFDFRLDYRPWPYLGGGAGGGGGGRGRIILGFSQQKQFIKKSVGVLRLFLLHRKYSFSTPFDSAYDW